MEKINLIDREALPLSLRNTIIVPEKTSLIEIIYMIKARYKSYVLFIFVVHLNIIKNMIQNIWNPNTFHR